MISAAILYMQCGAWLLPGLLLYVALDEAGLLPVPETSRYQRPAEEPN